MREAIGTSYVVNFIIVFFVIFITLFIGTLSYTKAFKVKNKIIDIIEDYDGDIISANALKPDVQSEIDGKLKSIGYRISNKTTCDADRFTEKGAIEIPKSTGAASSYRYCVYQKNETNGTYYGVVAYIYFEVPIIGAKLEFPVYGETKTFMKA